MKQLAFDLGGSSGKMMLGEFTGDKLHMQLLHRFSNGALSLNGGLYWNTLGIYQHLCDGISKATSDGHKIKTIGIDTFSNDFGFVDAHGHLTSQVRCYRDARTEKWADDIYKVLSREQLHNLTGNQNALFNTVMQLAAMIRDGQEYFFKNGNTMLLLPDLLGFLLTGEKGAEYSIASVTQMFSFATGDWNDDILRAFNIPRDMLPPVRDAGTILAPLNKQMQNTLGATGAQVVSVCEHDTASAVAALPTNERDVAFISSGTWSLLGTELNCPIINSDTLAYNFAIEGGAQRSQRLLKNIMGLWLVQECRRIWAEQGRNYTYAELEQMARAESEFCSLIDPDHPSFYMPGDMPQKVIDLCAQTGQPIPDTDGKIIRCIIESLALKYRWSLERMQKVTGKSIKAIYIIGGGGQDDLLNQCAANACGCLVYAGLYEAALCGNVLMQLYALGEISNLEQGRELIARSFELKAFEPKQIELWQEKYQKFIRLFKLEI